MKINPKIYKSLAKLYETISTLRAPDGCDWDHKQTSESLIPYLLEETHEVIQAIDSGDSAGLKEELGDLLLHILFQAQLAEDKSEFNLYDVMDGVDRKLKHRHPNLFSENGLQLNDNWETRKQKDKNRKNYLDGVPISMPALSRASRIQEKASQVGFDWNDIQPVFSKLFEEIDELKVAIKEQKVLQIKEELGDLLFTIVNLSRFLNVNPENALNGSTGKFEDRFGKVEIELKKSGKSLKDSSLEEMDKIWNRVKNETKMEGK